MIVLKATQDKVLAVLQSVAGIVERRHTLPILANVLIKKTGKSLQITTSDLEIQIRTTADLDGDTGNFTTTVGARKLIDILRTMPSDQTVSLESSQNKLILKGGKSRFTLQSLPAEDFPLVQESTALGPTFSVPQKTLKELLHQVSFSMAVHDIRYYLNGILFVAEGKQLSLVATDGHRLARVETPAPDGSPGMPGIIIPRKAVNEIIKLVEIAGEEVKIELSASKIRMTFGTVVLTSKLIDGTFPDYQRVIPAGNDKVLVTDKAEFAAAVDRVSTISSERGRAVKLSVADRKLTLSVTNPDSGSATEEIEVDYDSTPLEIGFNARYLLDITNQLDSDTAFFKLSDSGSPTVIQDRDGSNALYVLMPMRV